MTSEVPDIDALAKVVIDVASQFGRAETSADDGRKVAEDLLFGGAQVWECYRAGILHREEVCSRFLGDLETYVRRRFAVDWSKNRDWLTPTLESRVAKAMGFASEEPPL